MLHAFLDGLASGALCFAAWSVQRLPLSWALALGRTVGRIGFLFAGKKVRLAYANLKFAFPQSTPGQRRQWIREMFRNLGMNGVEILRFPVLTRRHIEDYVEHVGYETYLRERWKGKGLILLTQHMGNWEYSQIVEGVHGRPVTVLTNKQRHKRVDAFLNSLRRCHGTVLVERRSRLRELVRTLQEGGCAGILADQSGGEDGVWVRFFGRLIPAPRGPMALALKLKVTVQPAFFLRKDGPYHRLVFEPPMELVRTDDPEKDIQTNMQNYFRLLESYLTRYPTQWLWGHKRWKRTRTKRILILSDGKAGHLKQSETLAGEIVRSGNQKTPACEISVEKVEVKFRGPWHRRLFYLLAPFFIPRAQGCLKFLHFFLTPPSAEKLEAAVCDLILSAGSALVPLNLCLARENSAKSIVLMKPAFPFNFFRYDLALVPSHDTGRMPGGHFRIRGVLSGLESEELEASGKRLARSLRDPRSIRLSLFLGGGTRSFKLSLQAAETLLDQLERAAESVDGDFLVTTSRRTSAEVVESLRRRLHRHPRCQLYCVAAEDTRPEVVPGMMSLADFLIVTEDSISMISEALRSGKRVIVVTVGSNGLPRKHQRFQENLKKEWGVPVVAADRLGEVLERHDLVSSQEKWHEEKVRLREKVGGLL